MGSLPGMPGISKEIREKQQEQQHLRVNRIILPCKIHDVCINRVIHKYLSCSTIWKLQLRIFTMYLAKGAETLCFHYSDVIISAMASQITGVQIVWLIVCSGADQRKHQSSAILGLCEGNPPVTDGFPSQRASNAENVSIWWPHHVVCSSFLILAIDMRKTGKGRNKQSGLTKRKQNQNRNTLPM